MIECPQNAILTLESMLNASGGCSLILRRLGQMGHINDLGGYLVLCGHICGEIQQDIVAWRVDVLVETHFLLLWVHTVERSWLSLSSSMTVQSIEFADFLKTCRLLEHHGWRLVARECWQEVSTLTGVFILRLIPVGLVPI